MEYKDEYFSQSKLTDSPNIADDIIEICHRFIMEYEKPNYLEAGAILETILNILLESKEQSDLIYDVFEAVLGRIILDNVNTSITFNSMHILALLITDTNKICDDIRNIVKTIKYFYIQSTNIDMRSNGWILLSTILTTSKDEVVEFVKENGIMFLLESYETNENEGNIKEIIKIIYAVCKMFSEYEKQRKATNKPEEDEEESLPEINDDLLDQLNRITELVVHMILSTRFWKRASGCLAYLIDIDPINHYIYYESDIMRKIRHGFIEIANRFLEDSDNFFDIEQCSRIVVIEDSITNLLSRAHKTSLMDNWPLEPMVNLVFGYSSSVSISALRFLDLFVKQYQSTGITYISQCGAISKLGNSFDDMPNDIKKEAIKLFCSMILESEGNQITAVVMIFFDYIMDYFSDSCDDEACLIAKVITFLISNNRHEFVNERREDITSYMDDHYEYPEELDYAVLRLDELYGEESIDD